MTKRISCLLAAITFFLFTSPAQSEWFASVPPKAGKTAVETAGAAPADSSLVLAWNLEGQFDLLDALKKTQAIIQADGDENDLYSDIEHQFGRSPEQILSYFSGAGYVSLREGAATDPQVIVAMSVKDYKGLSEWLHEMLKDEAPVQRNGFRLYFDDEDDAVLGLDGQWMFFGLGKGAKPYALSTFKGDQPLMSSETQFRDAFRGLGYRESGLAVYMNKGFYSSLLGLASRMFGLGSTSASPIWEYGAGAVDFKAETGDLFLKLSGDSKALLVMGQPGGLKPSLVQKVPGDLNAYVAVDTAWYANVIETLSGEHAPLEMMYQYARRALNDFGDTSDAFSGPVVVGSDVFDRLRPGSEPPTIVAIAELDNVHETHRIALKATESEIIDTPAHPQIYNSPQGFSLRLDSTAEELRLVWGPRKEDFLQRKPSRRAISAPLVQETLNWSKDELALLAFFDLNDIVDYWRSADVSGDGRIAKEFVRQFLDHSRLQGVIAVKSSPEGIHYRVRGLAASPLIPAGFLGGVGFWTLTDSGEPAAAKSEVRR